MMSRTFEGEGELYDADRLLGRVMFEIRYSQDRIPAGHMGDPHATVPGLKRVEGSIEPLGPGVDLMALVMGNPQLTLRFPEGEWKCLLTSPDGSLVNSGGLRLNSEEG